MKTYQLTKDIYDLIVCYIYQIVIKIRYSNLNVSLKKS